MLNSLIRKILKQEPNECNKDSSEVHLLDTEWCTPAKWKNACTEKTVLMIPKGTKPLVDSPSIEPSISVYPLC